MTVGRVAVRVNVPCVERLRLPIGLQTFRRLREEGHYYVDKTPHLLQLVERGTHYFLSRPRRFGKSLLLDTAKELFEGCRELFAGLAADGAWNWDARHPVVRIDFGAGSFARAGELETRVDEMLTLVERAEGIEDDLVSPAGRLGHVLRKLHERSGRRAVLLVDEYDKPILDALDDPELARANRDCLRGLYSVVKSCDADIEFSLITGVTKFSKVSLFSGINNLRDITLDPSYSDICGYTEADLDRVFAPELEGLDRDKIRTWYNGYGWLGEERVYNPFDILLLFDTRKFKAHWFETGTHGARLFDLLEAGDFDGLKGIFHAFYAGIPHEWYTNNAIATYEGYYAAVFYAYFVSAGLDVRVEDSTNRGRLDMAVRFGGAVILFEFKVVEQAGSGTALAQLRAKGYAEKYRGQGHSVHLIGVEFSSATRNVERFDVSRGCSD